MSISRSCAAGWNTIMHDIMYDKNNRNGGCDPDDGSCGSWLAVPYFVSFVVLSSFIVLKMLIAVILETYLVALQRDASHLQVEHTDAFLEAWGKFDPLAMGRLPIGKLVDMVRLLPTPLGLDPSDFPLRVVRRSSVLAYLLQSDLRCSPSEQEGGPPEVLFTPVLVCLLKDAYREDGAYWAPTTGRKKSHDWGSVLPDEDSKVGKQLRGALERHAIAMEKDKEDSMLVGDNLAACMLQDAWRRKKFAFVRGDIKPRGSSEAAEAAARRRFRAVFLAVAMCLKTLRSHRAQAARGPLQDEDGELQLL